MDAVKFKEQNTVFTKPESMTDEECGSLPAYRDDKEIISCWKLTPEELKKIQDTCVVWLAVVGRQQPPVWLGVESPFIEN